MSDSFDNAANRAGTWFRGSSLFASRVVVAAGALVIVGWVFDIAVLKSVVPGLVTMKVNTALCFMLSGVALGLLSEDPGSSRRSSVAEWPMWVVIALSTVTLAEYWLSRNLGIDQLLVREAQVGGIPAAPGRMALTSALGFAFTGLALLLLARKPGQPNVGQVFAVLGGFNALLALAGYAYRAPALIDVSIRGVRSHMAVSTAVLFVILAFGILATRPTEGFMATITSRNAGGVTARRMLPFAIFVPMTLGWLRLYGELAGLYATNFGTAIFAVSNVVVFTVLILLAAQSLNRSASERMLAMSAMKESEKRYRALFDYAPDGIVIADGESYYLDANASICRMLGYAHDEMVGLHASDIVVPTEVEHVSPALTTIKARAEYHREWQFRRKDGSVFEAEVMATQMPDGNLMGVIRDITERKRAEEALRESEARLQAVTENLTEGLIIAGLDGRLVHWNRAGLEMHGYSNLEEGLREIGEFAQTFMLATLDGTSVAFEQWPMNRVLQGDRLQDCEVRLRRLDSDWERILSYSGRIITDATGKSLAFLAINDITARKRAEQALRESEEQFRTMANSIPQFAWMAHADGSIFWYNQRWYDYTGTTPEEMEGWGWQSVHDPEILPQVLERWRRAIATGQPFEMELPLRGTDAKFRTFLTRVEPMKESDGAVVRWFGTNTDVDELKRMDESLRGTQARLQSTLAAGSIGTWTWDIVNDRLVADEFTARMFSIDTGAAAKGLPAETYIQSIVKEDQPAVAAGLAQAIAVCGHYDIEYRVRQESGELRWLQARGRVEGDGNGNALSFHGAVVDINDRKRAEEALVQLNESLEQRVIVRTAQLEAANAELQHSRAELKSLFESLPGLYLVLTPDLKIVAASDAYLRATLTTREGLLGRHIFEVFPDNPDDPETTAVANMQASIDRVFKNARPDTMAIQKHDVRGPGGVFEEHYWSPVNSPVFGADRQIQYIVHRVEEVTDFIRQKGRASSPTEELSARVQQMEAEVFQSSQKLQATNQQLEAANHRLESAGRHKSEFLAGMSHELRTPLNGIIGFTEFLIDEKPGPLLPKQKEYLADVLNSANHLLQLINDVLDMAKVESGKMDVRPETFSVRKAIGEVAAVVEGIARKKNVNVAMEISEGLDAVLLDLHKFKQVLYNLLSNAVKFTDAGGRVHIHARRLEPDQLEVRVRDTGIGIKAEDLNRLFIEFAQLDSGTSRRFEGTGLGLALTKKLITLQGGHVSVESEPRKGSLFIVVLPLPVVRP
jgi:PAS domain S-box-containing protein